MKSIKDLREQYNLITEKEEAETKKLTALVRAGLFDAKKLTSLKRALDKPVDKMTAQEKRMLLNLLDALMSEVLSNQPVYQKVKQNVMREAVVVDTKDYLSKLDPRYGRDWPTSKEAPGTLLLKRKAIRVFPDGQKVALYYAQAIDKYVSIPYGEIGINETLADIVRGAITNIIGGNDSNSSAKKDEDEIAKELKPLEREKAKLNVSSDLKDKPYTTGVEARRQKYERDANYAMAKGVRESFRSNLQDLNEDDADYLNRRNPWLGTGGMWDTDWNRGGFGGGSTSNRIKLKMNDTGEVSVFGGKAVKIKPKIPPKIVPRRRPPNETPDRRRRDDGPSPRGPGRYEPSPRKPSGPPTRKPVEQPKPQKPVEQPKPQKPVEQPKPSRFNPPKVEPDVKQPLKPTTPANVPEVKPGKETSPNREAPAYKPKPAARPEFPGKLPAAKPGNKPDIAPTQQPSSQPSPLKKPQNQPWKGAEKWEKTQERPANEPAKNEKKKPDEEGAKKREPKDTKPPRKPFKLPALAADVGAKELTAMTPGLKLTISGPKREGDSDAIRSRLASFERKAWQAQASAMTESFEINLNGNRFVLNNEEANKVISLYESLNTKNKQKMIKMMNESEEQLNKIVSFAVRQ